MAYTDQQIADYAHQLEGKGASSQDIETFVKAAKADQTSGSNLPSTTPQPSMPSSPPSATNSPPANPSGSQPTPTTPKTPTDSSGFSDDFGAGFKAGIEPNVTNDQGNSYNPETTSTPPPGGFKVTDTSQPSQPFGVVGDVANAMGEGLNNFVQGEAPDMQAAMDQQDKTNLISAGGNILGQAWEGTKNIAGGFGKFINQAPVAAKAAYDLATGNYAKNDTPEGQKMVDQSQEAFGGINQSIGGLFQLVSSPTAASPVLQKGLSMPFEGVKQIINAGASKLGVDPNSTYGKVMTDSLFNGLLLAAGVSGDVIDSVKEGKLSPQAAWESVKQTAGGVKNLPNFLTGKITDAIDLTKDNITKSPEQIAENLNKTTGQIVQGKMSDVAPASRALNNIDTAGVKTYSDLSGKLKNHLTELKNQQDSILSKEPTAYKLSNFDKEITSGDTTIKTNPVKDALNQLKELYQKTSAPEDLARITDLSQKAKKYSLTLKDVNDLAREYGTEFGRKAFDKKGDPLTSVNAQAYENTRTGIKNAVRDELPNDQAKQLDKQMSDAINTKNLADQMSEKVNALKQKVQERGIGQKIGRGIANVIDVATGGMVKGFIDKYLSRGTGLKTLNALDLESYLSKNLKKIDKWNETIDKNPEKFAQQFKKR